ncbi:MAG: FAD-dependent oxidoreductase, partial [Mesorhizobium sp.]
WQGRAGTARHDAVAWAYARAASRLGVDIVQNCEIRDFLVENGRCRGVVTSRGTIRGDRIGMTVAGHSSVLAAQAGFRLPINSYALQACVTEPVKPVLDTVVLSLGTGT